MAMLKGFWIDMTSITIILEDDKTIQITEWKTSELVTITERYAENGNGYQF